MRRVPDLSKINQLIGYAPTMCLDEILADIIRHHRGEPRVVHTNGHGKFVEAAHRCCRRYIKRSAAALRFDLVSASLLRGPGTKV